MKASGVIKWTNKKPVTDLIDLERRGRVEEENIWSWKTVARCITKSESKLKLRRKVKTAALRD